MTDLIQSDDLLLKRFSLIRKYLGLKGTFCFLSEMPELGRCDEKRLVSLIGLALFSNESGQMKAKRKIYGGRKYARNMLYMNFLSIIRYRKGKAFKMYEKKINEGKPKRLAMVAGMRILVIELNKELKKIENCK